MLVLKKKCLKKMLVAKKIVGLNIFLGAQKKFWVSKILVSKKFYVHIFFPNEIPPSKIFSPPKIFDPKTILGLKNVGSNKNLCLKKFGPKTFWSTKIIIKLDQ